MTAHPGCRIKSIRPKNGSAKVIIFPDSSVKDRIGCLRRVRDILDNLSAPMAGAAFVVWDANLQSGGFIAASARSRIPSIAMPEFIKNRLIAAKIEEWGNDE